MLTHRRDGIVRCHQHKRFDLSLGVGKAWLNGLAVDLSWGQLDRIDALAERDDRELFLTLSYQFGRPPN